MRVVCSIHFLTDFETEPQLSNITLKRIISNKTVILKGWAIKIVLSSAKNRRKHSNVRLETRCTEFINHYNTKLILDLKLRIDKNCIPIGINVK
uniref:Uncharacterized protein n=1 Tax=Lepeophtheirus salmonis TaxID=72036 RepID=A0A0K2TP89_LEPSM